MLDEEEFQISFNETDGKGLEVALKNQYPVFQNQTEIRPDKIYLIDTNGNKLYPEEIKLHPEDNKPLPVKDKAGNLFGEDTVYTFRDAVPGKYTLFIESIEKFQDINLEVDLLN
jgi:nitrous oxide reductase